MTEEITKETIIMMGANARLETSRFDKDTFDTLLKKYRKIRDSSEFIEESISKFLQEQIEETVKVIGRRDTEIQLLEMMNMIFDKPKT